MTDPTREAREAGGYRPGLIFPLPRAAHPDTRLEIDAAPPEAAALSRAERPPTVLDIPETKPAGKLTFQDLHSPVDRARPGANPTNGPGIAPLEYTGQGSAPHTVATGVNIKQVL